MILASSSPVGLALGLATAAAYAVPAVAAARLQARGARTALWLAWVLHAATLAWSMLETTPRFGFAPALSVTAWLVLTVYAIEHHGRYRHLGNAWSAGMMRAHKKIFAQNKSIKPFEIYEKLPENGDESVAVTRVCFPVK